MTFKSTDVTTGVLDIKIEANSVDTGSGMKNGKLKGKDFNRREAGAADYVCVDKGDSEWSGHF